MWGSQENWETVGQGNGWKALLLAVLLLGFLLTLPLTRWQLPVAQESELWIQLTAAAEESVRQPEVENTEPEQANEPVVIAPQEVEPEQKIIAEEPINTVSPNIQINTSITSDAFRRWIENDTQQYIKDNPLVVEGFANTFKPRQFVRRPDINYQQGPLGGGNYKVRRNGKTCEQLVMVPLSFDDHLLGTITTAGKCRDDNPLTLDLSRGRD